MLLKSGSSSFKNEHQNVEWSNLPHELLLALRQTAKLRNAIENHVQLIQSCLKLKYLK